MDERRIWPDFEGVGGVHKAVPRGDNEIYILVPVIKLPNDTGNGLIHGNKFDSQNYDWLPVPKTPRYERIRDARWDNYPCDAVCGADHVTRGDISVGVAQKYSAVLSCDWYDSSKQARLQQNVWNLEYIEWHLWMALILVWYFFLGVVLVLVVYPFQRGHRPGPVGSLGDRILGGSKKLCRAIWGTVLLFFFSVWLWPLRILWVVVWENLARTWAVGAKTGYPNQQNPRFRKFLAATTLSGKRWRKILGEVDREHAKKIPGHGLGSGSGSGSVNEERRGRDIELGSMTAQNEGQDNPFEDPQNPSGGQREGSGGDS